MQTPYTAILSKSGKGRHVIRAHSCAHSRNAWVENIANAWLPYTNIIIMGDTLGGISFKGVNKNTFRLN